MKVAVFRTDRDGPAQVWVLSDAEAPPTAAVPGVDASGVFNRKGSALTWEQWAQRLALSPQLGNWSLEDVPDLRASSPWDALNYVRLRELERNATL